MALKWNDECGAPQKALWLLLFFFTVFVALVCTAAPIPHLSSSILLHAACTLLPAAGRTKLRQADTPHQPTAVAEDPDAACETPGGTRPPAHDGHVKLPARHPAICGLLSPNHFRLLSAWVGARCSCVLYARQLRAVTHRWELNLPHAQPPRLTVQEPLQKRPRPCGPNDQLPLATHFHGGPPCPGLKSKPSVPGTKSPRLGTHLPFLVSAGGRSSG